MTPEHSETEEKILESIRPSDALPGMIKEAVDKVAAETGTDVLLGGSTAKGTYLADNHDIDIFVRYKPDTKDISDKLEKSLKKIFKNVQRIPGSRDYFLVEHENYQFEFIPVILIKSWKKAENVTDMSPLHVEYVKGRMDKHPWLADEVRLLKQFCKGAKVYGAESYVGGFSGYMVELLTLHYGTFKNVLKAVSKWEPKVILDPEEHHEDPVKELNDAKTFAPLVLVDPVQQDRNAAAALTQDVFNLFVQASREYLKKGDAKSFEVIHLSPEEFNKQTTGLDSYSLKLTPKKSKKDVMGAKCFKIYGHISRLLRLHGFSVEDEAWEFLEDYAICLFAFPKKPLSAEEELLGPPTDLEEHAARFRKEHKRVEVRDGRLYAKEKRKFTKAKDLLDHLQKEPYVKDRVEKAELTEL